MSERERESSGGYRNLERGVQKYVLDIYTTLALAIAIEHSYIHVT